MGTPRPWGKKKTTERVGQSSWWINLYMNLEPITNTSDALPPTFWFLLSRFFLLSSFDGGQLGVTKSLDFLVFRKFPRKTPGGDVIAVPGNCCCFFTVFFVLVKKWSPLWRINIPIRNSSFCRTGNLNSERWFFGGSEGKRSKYANVRKYPKI